MKNNLCFSDLMVAGFCLISVASTVAYCGLHYQARLIRHAIIDAHAVAPFIRDSLAAEAQTFNLWAGDRPQDQKAEILKGYPILSAVQDLARIECKRMVAAYRTSAFH